MKSSAGFSVTGRTRWRRFPILFVPALGAVGTVLAMMATGALATPLAISGTQFTVAATNLTTGSGPDQFTQYGGVDFLNPTAHTGASGVAVNVIKNATLTDLDQVVCAPTGLGNNLLVELKATKAEASDLVVDATKLSGSATFNNIRIGVQGPGGTFAQIADTANIDNLSQTALFTQAGVFKLTGMTLGATLVATCP